MAGDPGPRLFRINIEVGDIARATAFYSELLGQAGRPDRGARCYFSAGAVTLQVVQVETPSLAAKTLYFSVGDLMAVHARAAALECLSQDLVHGAPAGDPAVRPWGEKSFYADDPWGNPLCFVEAGTIYAA
ncbi:MAG TPA: VOC family protein [Caulobacteraceae bacterium]|jgi:catechol 2,3-dioxygenase-like lactoylglutathione lyase family enzyme|nr:VOC family protein [Caulobacteraceae bacterium]